MLNMNSRVLFIVHSLGNGGAERVVSLVSSSLVAKGHKVSIATLAPDYSDYSLNADIPIIFGPGETRSKLATYANYIKHLNKTIQRERPDIIVSFDAPVNIILLLSGASGARRIIISERNDPVSYPPNTILRILRKLLYHKANKVVFQTTDQMEFFSPGIRKKSTVIPNPVISDLPDARTFGREARIVCVARLVQQKNIKMLLDSFSDFMENHKSYKLELYGRGDEEAELRAYAQDIGISDKVIFKGFSKDIHRDIAGAAMFILPSNYEGMPNALIEAMAMGMPVISTDCPCGGPRSLIIDGVNGLLVKVGDREGLTKAISNYVEHPQFAAECGKNAFNIRFDLSVQTIADRWDSVLLD